jgi:hypothetical protein
MLVVGTGMKFRKIMICGTNKLHQLVFIGFAGNAVYIYNVHLKLI